MKIKFNKYHVTNGEVKARVSYSLDNRGDERKCVTLYSKDWGHQLRYFFPEEYKNDSDIRSDYYEKGHVTLFEDHPYYEAARKRAESK